MSDLIQPSSMEILRLKARVRNLERRAEVLQCNLDELREGIYVIIGEDNISGKAILRKLERLVSRSVYDPLGDSAAGADISSPSSFFDSVRPCRKCGKPVQIGVSECSSCRNGA